MLAKVILLNGAKLCGKDTAVDYLQQRIPLKKREAKDKLHKLVQELFCVSEDRYWEIYSDRSLKETPMPEFKVSTYAAQNLRHLLCSGGDVLDELNLNLSVRQAQIYVSEIICKPLFGRTYFGVTRAASIDTDEVYIDGSCGFVKEIYPIINKVGQENIMLIRIHREGCNFEGDSRSLIPSGVVDNTIDIHNNGTEQEFLDKVYNEVTQWLGE